MVKNGKTFRVSGTILFGNHLSYVKNDLGIECELKNGVVNFWKDQK